MKADKNDEKNDEKKEERIEERIKERIEESIEERTEVRTEKRTDNHQVKHPYDDIINLEYPVLSNHVRMSRHDRAAQFSPFAALTGYEGAIKETARLPEQRIELDEDEKTILDEKLRIIQEQLNGQQEIKLVYFRPDEKKAGGTYLTVRGIVKKIDKYECVVVMQDRTRIPIEEIIDITGEMFQDVDDLFA